MRRRQGKARETLDTAGVHRAVEFTCRKAPHSFPDEHHFGQHEVQVGERLEQLIGRRGIVRVESVEREEHRLPGSRPRQPALGIVPAVGNGDTAPRPMKRCAVLW